MDHRSWKRNEKRMPWSSLSGSWTIPKVVDVGRPFLNRAADGLLKIGTVMASLMCTKRRMVHFGRGIDKQEGIPYYRSKILEKLIFSLLQLKRICKEGAYWGTIAGLYVGMEFGMEKICGTRDWKNALWGGTVTGAITSAVSNRDRDRVVADAITGGALATAAEFPNDLTLSDRSSPVETV